jgi:Zn-dependent protease with chaperone function
MFDNLPEFAAPAQPVSPSATDPLDASVDFADALAGATASIDAAVQQQLKRNAYAVGAKMTTQQIIASFGNQIDPIERSEGYGRSLATVATTMLVLPALFVLLVVGGTLAMTWLVWSWFHSEGTGELLHPAIFCGVVLVIVLLLAAWIPVLNMIIAGFAIVFSGRHASPGTRPLTREAQPVLYEFVDQICQKLNAPPPKRIDLNCDYNASASFDRGWLSFKKNELVLTLGVPLIASHSAEQLASVIAHEFGHFCQGGGMRAHYLIRNLNGWFINAAIEKTIRDEVNAYILSNSEHGAGFVWAISYVIGYLGRHMMWWFGYAGNAVSGVLSREMEYDADKYAVHLAGTKTFVDSMNTVEKYGVAYAVTVDNLKMLFFDGVLVNNIPRLMMHIAKTMPGAVTRKIAEASEKEKQQALDTHPPTRERIKAAKSLAKPGIVRVGRPARDLVDHWSDLCQVITLAFYSQVTGHNITSEHVTKLEDILAAEHKLLLDKE